MLIQRFDGDYAVLQTEEGVISVHRAHLPSGAKAGDSVSCSDGGYTLSQAGSENISGEVRDRLHRLLTGEDD